MISWFMISFLSALTIVSYQKCFKDEHESFAIEGVKLI